MDLSNGVLIATSNKGKIREIKHILGELKGLSLVLLSDIHEHGFDVVEDGDTFMANALIKAKAYAEAFNYVALADDSGLEVDLLNGAPGINSARYAGIEASDQDRVKKLLTEMEGVPKDKRTARFRCVVCLYDPVTGEKLFAEGACEGTIATSPSGNNGFGYDPIFIPEGFKMSMAELSAEQKNDISHRGRAISSLREKLLHTK